ncbi:MAG TPA: hypothetical protein VJ936_04710 [Desulfobacteraceae bacterium]|nr:hypothetical protein [Desulfobacteraceae bacterium]
MSLFHIKGFFIAVLVLSGLCFPACSQSSDTVDKEDWILECGSTTISLDEFRAELELKKAAYPYSIHNESEGFRRLVLDLVAQLSEELVLLAAAEDRGCRVSAREVQEAAAAFQGEYPENAFEAMLVENAVSYAFWKKRFAIQLTIDRLVEKELKQKIEITPEEISQYYDQQKSRDGQQTEMDEEGLIAQLRRKKAENAWFGWVQSLAEQYPVVVSHKGLERFLKNKNF